MKITTKKAVVDTCSGLIVILAIITGLMLHWKIWHESEINHDIIWNVHVIEGLTLLVLGWIHCKQHSAWFKNYSKIKKERRRVTTILLIIGLVVIATGIIIICGYNSEMLSHIHYVGAIIFTGFVIGHVAKRWKMYISLVCQI